MAVVKAIDLVVEVLAPEVGGEGLEGGVTDGLTAPDVEMLIIDVTDVVILLFAPLGPRESAVARTRLSHGS